MKTKKRERLEKFPYIPNRPEWADIPWDKAKEINPDVDGFIGHNSTHFAFQVRGECEVLVSK